MAIASAVIKRLNELLFTLSKRERRVLIFFKGFKGDFYKELQKKTIYSLSEKKWINENGYVDVKRLSDYSRELILKFLTSNELIIWGYYEEFITLTESLNSIKEQFDGDIYIIDNNLFQKFYFLDLEDNAKFTLLDYFSKEETEELPEIKPYIKFYSDAIKLEENKIAIAYINKYDDEEIRVINFYEDAEINYSPLNQEYNIISLRDSSFELFKDRLQAGETPGKIQLLIESDGDKKLVVPILSFCHYAGLEINVCRHNKFSELAKEDENKYLDILKKYWGKNSEFRLLKFYKNPDLNNDLIEISQGHIISEIIKQCEKALNGCDDYSDIFITAPTGSGKSLLFQLPAIHIAEKWKAVTIVITPLIALMRDQVTKLTEENEVEFATFLNSEITFDEKERRISRIKDGEFSIIYLSPELLLANAIDSIIGDRKIGLIVIDEAHLVTTWGRDFRADYWFLGDYIDKLRRLNRQQFPILCLTATAVYMGSEDVVTDTVASLNLKNHKLYLGNVRRDNISFDINYLPNKEIHGSIEDFKINKTKERIEEFIDKKIKSLVYCPYVSQVEDVFNSLEDKYKDYVGKYYGSFDKYEKVDSYEKFKYGDYTTMICTKAFGMGVDISDIQLVYHYAPTGNLADYVQEIGRAARDRNIKGIAMTDFTDKDMKYVRMLYGLSSMRQYQLKEMMRKLYQIYKDKGSRNFLVSPEAFSYMFNETEVENKVKNGLLLISKDLESKYNFPVIVIRPKSLFTKNYINVPPDIEQEFLERFGEYAIKIEEVSPRIIPSYNQNGDVIIYNTGNIYEMNMALLWEKDFNHLTFAQFKRSFFEGELFSFSNDEKISPRINVIIHFNDDFDNICEQLKDCATKLTKIFAGFKNRGEVFTKLQFKETYKKEFQTSSRNDELPNVLLDLFVADISRNTGFNQNVDKFKFIQERKAHNRDELIYRVMNSNYTILKNYLSRLISQCSPNISKNTFSTYVAISKNNNQNNIVYLAILLELFGLASYEIIGGKNTEIFVRVNDPAKLRRLSQSNYSNGILTDIERKRNRSQKVLMEFMKKKMTDEERWNIIEDYFLGRDEKISAFLGIS